MENKTKIISGLILFLFLLVSSSLFKFMSFPILIGMDMNSENEKCDLNSETACSINLENKINSNKGNEVNRSIDNLKLAKETQILNLQNQDKINLSIDIIKKEIAGKEIRMFGYNGQIPGPLLYVKQNSQIFINVTNNLDTDTTIHWHGLRLDNKFDGVPEITMKIQEPGESFEYKLDFIDEGIYWYHPHVREDYQQELGVYMETC